eukprot:NODE_3632_length_649_cov_34.158333_g2600_i0.p4 GENE.NODE_3632_length_649_cov_34.158333_g2600_i0~~NODE_3632_length_649_cov_34.158333_g2600_i0.p4  ORF type:complete len:59 (-),score=4.99 NODE_3632_length_649_cov_34.158333_g2600_i0:205-381(-)
MMHITKNVFDDRLFYESGNTMKEGTIQKNMNTNGKKIGANWNDHDKAKNNNKKKKTNT